MEKEVLKKRLPDTIKVVPMKNGDTLVVYQSKDVNTRDGISLPRCSYSSRNSSKDIAINTVLESLVVNEFSYKKETDELVKYVENYGNII